MSRFSHYTACPKCRANGKDSRGDNLGIYQDGSQHCWACGYHHFPTNYQPQIKEVNHGTKSILPSDFSKEVPAVAWQWLLQYELSYQYWHKIVGFSPSSKRLVFRVGDPLAFSTGRLIPEASGTLPSTVTGNEVVVRSSVPSVDAGGGKLARKWWLWGNCHKHTEVINASNADDNSPTILVEDLISAHKVGQVAKAIPLFGTQIHPCHLYYLNSVGGRVVLWLDKDQEGYMQKKALNLEALINRPVEITVTKDDPKALSVNVIKGILGVNP